MAGRPARTSSRSVLIFLTRIQLPARQRHRRNRVHWIGGRTIARYSYAPTNSFTSIRDENMKRSDPDHGFGTPALSRREMLQTCANGFGMLGLMSLLSSDAQAKTQNPISKIGSPLT